MERIVEMEQAEKTLQKYNVEVSEGKISTTKSIFYPPGGLLIWIVIYLELLTFGLGFVALAYYGATARAIFHQDSLMLNKTFGTINTILLLTGGYFAARGLHSFRKSQFPQTAQNLLFAMVLGVGFLIVKGVEYYLKWEAGIGMDYSTFYIFYWLMTGFHWIHVLVGVVILAVLRQQILRKKPTTKLEDFEAGISFWHMCDIIWLLLFPILYLLF